MRIPCTACQGLPQSQAQYCHECKGVRFIERFDRVEGCNRRGPDETPSGPCPIEFEPMVEGWICTHCGESGPL